ncbi:hypothetical protein FRC04_003303 [Tulasnella sp. 424]|nr:hypothetical protein FRC04_003303 [Tulasnella sp. 424]
MSKNNKSNNPLDMASLKAEDREATLPLYLQRLLKRLQDLVPDEQDPAYYDLCILCHAARDKNELWLTESSSAEEFQLLAKLTVRGRVFTMKPQFEKNPYENIPEYVTCASLPPIPWRSALKSAAPPRQDGTNMGFSTHVSSPAKPPYTAQPTNTGASEAPGGMTIRKPDNVRRLRQIYRLDMVEFGGHVAAYVETLPIGFQTLREVDGSELIVDMDIDEEQLSIPAFSFHTNTGLSRIKAPQNEYGVQNWVYSLAAKTASTLLHLSDHKTNAYSFGDIVGKGAPAERSDLCWQCGSEEESETLTKSLKRLVIEVNTPWTLDPITFKEFVETDHLPTADELQAARQNDSSSTGRWSATKVSFSKVQNIWAQVYDYCVTQGIYFFVLTSYEFWAFGVFSVDYTSAQVTDPIPYDSKKPTVLASLMYWTQSAMLVPDLHSIPWGELRRNSKDDTIRALADNVCLHRSRMDIIASTKLREKPWATAKRFMKNLGVSPEQEFSRVWDQLVQVPLVKMEEQRELDGVKDLDSAPHLLPQNLPFQNLFPPTASTDKERMIIKEEDPDDIFHGSIATSHGLKIPFLDQTDHESRRPSLPRRRVSSQSNSQPSWPKFDQYSILPDPILQEQPPFSTIASTPLHVISPASDFRRRVSEPNLHHSLSEPYWSSPHLVIKSEDPARTEPDHGPGPFNSTAGSFPLMQYMHTLNEDFVGDVGSKIPSIHISTAEHQITSAREPPTMRQNDGLTYTPTVSTFPTAGNLIYPWTEAHGSLPFAPSIDTGDRPPVPQYTGTSSSETWLQSFTSLSTLDVAQNTNTSSEILQTLDDILEVGLVLNSRGVEGFEGEAGQDAETAAHPWDFLAELLPLSSDNVHVQQIISSSWFCTPSSASNSLVAPGSESQALPLDVGGYTSEEPPHLDPNRKDQIRAWDWRT